MPILCVTLDSAANSATNWACTSYTMAVSMQDPQIGWKMSIVTICWDQTTTLLAFPVSHHYINLIGPLLHTTSTLWQLQVCRSGKLHSPKQSLPISTISPWAYHDPSIYLLGFLASGLLPALSYKHWKLHKHYIQVQKAQNISKQQATWPPGCMKKLVQSHHCWGTKVHIHT